MLNIVVIWFLFAFMYNIIGNDAVVYSDKQWST